jgi:outer membrane beta-barrel protein
MVKQFLLILLCAVVVSPAHAQEDTGLDEVETMFSKDESTPEPARPEGSSKPVQPGSQTDAKQADIKDVGDLGKLQSFKDISVISRRFLPKSQRWELYLAPALNLNDAFFLNFGIQGRVGYYFRERYGIEGIFSYMTVSEREVTSDLKEKRKVDTTAFVTTTSYLGVDFKWIPIYGKMTLNNHKITPFDVYFSAGLGLTGTKQGESVMSIHVGTGQAFALSKSSALRWDFSWYTFNAKSSVDTTGNSALYNNLVFTIGWSWFFPEATYR